MQRSFLQLDVFAGRIGAGNPLAVVLDARELDTAAMQAFAAWTNLSETCFVLPPVSGEASYRVRIFTPKQELPFAGHPSVGTAHAVLEAGIAEATDGALMQECGAGLLPIRVEGQGQLRRIFVRAPQAQFSPIRNHSLHLLDHALAGVARGTLPPSLVDNGPIWCVLEFADEAGVRAWQPPLDAIAEFTREAGAVGLAVFGRGLDASSPLCVRAFCPADGIPEDPVTGSANAAIAAWLRHNDALGGLGRAYSASQGREVGRDGRIEVRIDDEDAVWIGGQTQTVIRGSVDW
ncbi:MAG TPA: PhzF family phenazine biosynthesis protein [Arenimonas sp.]|nr:PhzF family phenazine biosynthesis protein [Arenimonas sp.]